MKVIPKYDLAELLIALSTSPRGTEVKLHVDGKISTGEWGSVNDEDVFAVLWADGMGPLADHWGITQGEDGNWRNEDVGGSYPTPAAALRAQIDETSDGMKVILRAALDGLILIGLWDRPENG